jgi:transposase
MRRINPQRLDPLTAGSRISAANSVGRRKRNLIERCFDKLKQFRHIATDTTAALSTILQ